MSPPIKKILGKEIFSELKNFDTVIDVRSPSEFLVDHIPGAVNLPVLNDSERITVGTVYKQIGPFEAKRLGAGLIAKNISFHIENRLSESPRDWKPLIYCWRGGSRSNAMSRIFSEIGWITSVIDGGYKSYRGAVLETLNRIPKKLNLIKISGKTGTGKTDILRTAEKQGAQIIDLEQLAKHRGSLLGQEPNTLQPKQRLFESRLCSAMLTLDLSRPVFIEAESNKIGQIHIPAELWARMRIASQVKIEVPVDERIKKLCLDYKHMIAEPKNVIVRLSRLKKRYGSKIFEKWKKYLETEDWYSFVKSLLKDHYDPSYTRSGNLGRGRVLLLLKPERLTKEEIETIAKELADIDGTKRNKKLKIL